MTFLSLTLPGGQMPQYLTPARYRTMGTGANLLSTADGVLANHIASASALVNAYCCVPAGYDFRGGTIVGEQHVWDVGNVKRSPSNRVWPFCRPIKTVSSLSIEITNNQSISFTQAGSLYHHATEGWVEPVDLALTSFGVFGYGILPNIGLRQPVARLNYTYGYDFYAEEVVTAQSGGFFLADNQFFTDEDIILIDANDDLVLPTDYTVNKTEGTVTMATPPTIGIEYTLSYHYKIPPAVVRATSMLVTDLIAAASLATTGVSILGSLKVEEVEIRSNTKTGFLNTGVHGAAASLLAPYVVRSMA
jgi:hypothetical protein